MAITNLRDRQSIVSINAIFSGPSVVPDGSFDQGDRQTIGYGYYPINVGDAVISIGGTSQLEAFASTGGLDVQTNHTIGAVSQLEAFASTGGLDVEGNKTIGATSQLEAFASTGGLDVEGNKTLGGISQLEALDSTGGLTVEITHTIGGVSQLGAFSSAGGIQVGDVVVTPPNIGGGGFFRRRLKRKKPKSFQQLLDLQSDSGAFEVEIPPVPIEETPTGIQIEVDRFEDAIEIVQAQEQQVEIKIDLLATKTALELLIWREILINDLLAARRFIQDLQEQADILKLIKRRRQEEEVIIMALMLDDDNMNITVH